MPTHRITRPSFVAGALFHAVAVLWIWRTWAPGSRSAWLVYMDLPLSLAWADLPGRWVLGLSLGVGSLWWGLITALLVLLVGRILAGGRRRLGR